MKKIEIIILPSGEMKIETKGFSGKGCQDASKFLEKIGNIQKDEKTSEYYENSTSSITQGVKNGNGN